MLYSFSRLAHCEMRHLLTMSSNTNGSPLANSSASFASKRLCGPVRTDVTKQRQSGQAVLSTREQTSVGTIVQAVQPCRGSSCRQPRVLPPTLVWRLAGPVQRFLLVVRAVLCECRRQTACRRPDSSRLYWFWAGLLAQLHYCALGDNPAAKTC